LAGIHGFSVLEADPQQFKVRFFDRNLSPLYEYVLKKSISELVTDPRTLGARPRQRTLEETRNLSP
jgi:hypothetical protein